MRVMLECGFLPRFAPVCPGLRRFAPDLLSRFCSQIRIFEGAILHDELSLSINILSILTVLRYVNGQNSALLLCHNNDRSGQALLQPRQQ
jgi:hypothetical protein